MTRRNTPVRLARSWNLEELSELLNVTDELDGVLDVPGGQVAERDYWRAFILAAFDSGMSPAQLRALDWRLIEPRTGRITIEVRFGTEALIAIARIAKPENPYVFSEPRRFDTPLKRFSFASRWRLVRCFAGLLDWKPGRE